MSKKYIYWGFCLWFGIAIAICGLSVFSWKFWLIMFSGHALAWTVPGKSSGDGS